MRIDLRSDTVTRPSAGMIQAIASAEVGDDVFGDDPTINALQKRVADMFGMEAALFFPSGTMANQVAIKTHVLPGDEVICDQTAHVYKYEGGGIAATAGASVRLLQGERGIFNAEYVIENINSDDPHFPRTSLLCIENTVNKGGGAIWPEEKLQDVCNAARSAGLKTHLDGARLWNAMVKTGTNPRFFSDYFHSISVCFSKGLGCPVGSVLLGNDAFIYHAKRHRKRLGGGMRQAGLLAAACNYALDHHVERLAEDHRRAALIGAHLQQLSFVKNILPVETNIVLFQLESPQKAEQLLVNLNQNEIYATHSGGGWIRFVLHLDIDDRMTEKLISVLN